MTLERRRSRAHRRSHSLACWQASRPTDTKGYANPVLFSFFHFIRSGSPAAKLILVKAPSACGARANTARLMMHSTAATEACCGAPACTATSRGCLDDAQKPLEPQLLRPKLQPLKPISQVAPQPQKAVCSLFNRNN